MTSYSRRVRALALISILSLCAGAVVIAADPKIQRAGHEQPAKLKQLETAETTEAVQPVAPPENPADVITYSQDWPETQKTGANFTRLGIGTLAVLVVCAGSLWFGKPWLKRLHVASNGNPSLFVEGTVSVGNRATLFLVRAGDSQLVAGVDATGLKSLIALPLTFKEVLDEQVPDTEPAAPAIVARPTVPAAATSQASTMSAPFDIRSLQRPFSRGTQ